MMPSVLYLGLYMVTVVVSGVIQMQWVTCMIVPTVQTGVMVVVDSCVRTGSGGIIMTAMATLC